jgi:hypothetical protein
MFELFQQVFVDLGTARGVVNIRNFLVKLNQLKVMEVRPRGQQRKVKAISFEIFGQQDAAQFLKCFFILLGKINKKFLTPFQYTILTEVKSIDSGLSDKFTQPSLITLAPLLSKSLIKSLNDIYQTEDKVDNRNIRQNRQDVNNIRGEKVQSLPQTLIIAIQKPDNSNNNNNIAYVVPDEIDMYPYLSEEAKISYPDQKAEYELIGVIMYSESHFISWVKDYTTTNRWNQYNDSQANEINSQYIDTVLRPTQDFREGSLAPYILFYRKKN